MEENDKKQLILAAPFWKQLTAAEQELILRQSHIKRFTKGQLISSSDTSCMGVVFVTRGVIRVSLISEEGREITLYRLSAGECCVTTASCVIQQITFDTIVSAGEETELVVIPSSVCARLVEENIYFRAFVYETETERYSRAIWVIQELLFKRFDQRLAACLVNAYERTGAKDLRLTQEELARDVNSAREVVARMLRHFAEEGLVEVKRGHILLKDIDGLKKI